jgi:hypothetical protein
MKSSREIMIDASSSWTPPPTSSHPHRPPRFRQHLGSLSEQAPRWGYALRLTSSQRCLRRAERAGRAACASLMQRSSRRLTDTSLQGSAALTNGWRTRTLCRANTLAGCCVCLFELRCRQLNTAGDRTLEFPRKVDAAILADRNNPRCAHHYNCNGEEKFG